MTVYIDAHKDRFGVEPICEVLPIAQSTYYDAKRRPPSANTQHPHPTYPSLGLTT